MMLKKKNSKLETTMTDKSSTTNICSIESKDQEEGMWKATFR
jgi:hypothetical protein